MRTQFFASLPKAASPEGIFSSQIKELLTIADSLLDDFLFSPVAGEILDELEELKKSSRPLNERIEKFNAIFLEFSSQLRVFKKKKTLNDINKIFGEHGVNLIEDENLFIEDKDSIPLRRL